MLMYSTLGGRGNWTTDGCKLARINGSVAVCHCSHLTNFGVLVVCKITQSPVIFIACIGNKLLMLLAY